MDWQTIHLQIDPSSCPLCFSFFLACLLALYFGSTDQKHGPCRFHSDGVGWTVYEVHYCLHYKHCPPSVRLSDNIFMLVPQMLGHFHFREAFVGVTFLTKMQKCENVSLAKVGWVKKGSSCFRHSLCRFVSPFRLKSELFWRSENILGSCCCFSACTLHLG